MRLWRPQVRPEPQIRRGQGLEGEGRRCDAEEAAGALKSKPPADLERARAELAAVKQRVDAAMGQFVEALARMAA